MKKSASANGCPPSRSFRTATDAPLPATPEELDSIRVHLGTIEKLLRALFGSSYSREPESMRVRERVAEIIEDRFVEIVNEWEDAITAIFGLPTINWPPGEVSPDLANALVRFLDHVRDPDDIRTYVYLRKHCQVGMISRAQPSQFNTIHIALKQIITKHLLASARRHELEALRNVVVAAIDERRLMVSWFYIESRESALRASEEKYRNSVNHAPDPMYEIDPGTYVVLNANSAVEKLHHSLPGFENVALVGKPVGYLMAPEMAEGAREHIDMVVACGSYQTFDLPVGPYFMDVNSALITYGNNRFVHMILHDVTHRREIMDELLKAERLAAAGTFGAGVAHEVNNPLASISSLVQSLVKNESDPARRTTMHTILSQITRISTTLKDLMNFSRPTTSQHKTFDLNHVITETLRLLNYDKRFAGVNIAQNLASDLKPVLADDNEIQQVILNLLFNAADATQPSSGTIEVATENVAASRNQLPHVAIRIRDNGIGIPEENLKRVFDPFFTTKPSGSGVGLGLSLCQRIILANSGTIKIESEVGKGTCVKITLPVALTPEERVQIITRTHASGANPQ